MEYEPIYELYNFVRCRIFIFIDQVAKHTVSIERVITRSQKDKIPITIFGAARINVWNLECGMLEKYVEEKYHLKFLKRTGNQRTYSFVG